MDIQYWIVEYGKVFGGYLFLMFLWPSVVFREHLREKSKTYYFGFCITVPIIIINTVVLILGLFYELRQWLICLILYGIFILAFIKNIITYLDRRYKRMVDAKLQDVRVLKGKYRALVVILVFFIMCGKYIKKAVHFLSIDYIKRIKKCNLTKVKVQIKRFIWEFIHRISSLFWKYGILAIVIIYGMIYFSYGAFQVRSYGYKDLYIHHEWIYGLVEGNIFQGGIYPEAMHCFIYCMHTLFGIRIYSILLFLQGIHVTALLLSVYFLLKKVFRWQYTPIFVLMMFLTLNIYNVNQISMMFRLQLTLPMEFGLHTVCLSALYLLNYLSRDHAEGTDRRGKVRKFYWDENLLLFMISLSAAIMTHFHVVIMAALVCVSFAVFALNKMCNRKYLIPLTVSVFGASVVAIVPMAGALMEGIPLNGSINWALNAINEGGQQKNVVTAMIDVVIGLYDKGYMVLYGSERGKWMIILMTAVTLFCCLIGLQKRLKHFRKACLGYLPVIVVSVTYMLSCMAPVVGIPNILPEGRFSALGHMMVLAVVAIPVDIVFIILTGFCNNMILRLLSLLSVFGIYGGAILTGNFRGFLYYELSRYNGAAEVTESIIETFPRYSYTIISPTDELYPVIQYGWHEELLSFMENCNSEEYSIPSEHVFIYVEKKPFLYAQRYFFHGPFWMGENRYAQLFGEEEVEKYAGNRIERSSDIIAMQISEEDADKEFPEYESAWSMYQDLENRTVLESKAYKWCQEFSKQHPSVLNIYYEDDEFVCYYFRQKPGDPLYELGTKQ